MRFDSCGGEECLDFVVDELLLQVRILLSERWKISVLQYLDDLVVIWSLLLGQLRPPTNC
jgi:hypothetical protein